MLGTGCFLLQNTGRRAVTSNYGLLTTVAYKLGKDEPTHYALEVGTAPQRDLDGIVPSGSCRAKDRFRPPLYADDMGERLR